MNSKLNGKYCAFGATGFRMLGKVLEKTNAYVKIKAGRWIEYWDSSFVKIFNSKEEAEKEINEWENLVDNR